MARTTATIPVGADTRQLERDIQIALAKDFKLKGFNEKAFTQPLGRITGATTEFQKSLDASNARVIAFGASAGIIYAVQKSFVDLIKTSIDVEKSLKDINVILNASDASLKSFSDRLFDIAKNTGQTFSEVAKAATEFARQGLGIEETLKRTSDALILTRLSGLDTISSVEALTSAVNSFSKTGLDSTTVINKLANVDAAFAVSSGDLASAIQRVGSSALDAGVSFDQLLAIVTSVQQTTARGGAVIGNSLKTIFTRVQREDTLSALQGVGIAVKDLQGNTLPALKVLEELAKKFDSLSDSQKSAIAEQVGGVFQINILKAALGDLSKEYSIYKNALDVAGSATDEAIQRNQALNETVSAVLNKTFANISRVSSAVGETAFKPTINNLLNLVNKGLDNVNLDSSTTGGKIGKGIVEGIGTFISGPGIVLLTAVLGKLFLNLGKFALDSLKSFLSLNKAAEQRSVIQQRILEIISKEPQLVSSILSRQTSLLQVENQILNVIKSQTLERQRAATIASQLSGNLISKGVTVSKGGVLTTKTKSEGHIPEIYGALAGGYIPGEIKKMFIPGEGQVIYNNAEEVKRFPGTNQPAIMPPEKSKAGITYKYDFVKKNGFDPYEEKRFAKGFIPNFANQFGKYYYQRKDKSTPRLTSNQQEKIWNRDISRGSLNESLIKFPSAGLSPQQAYGAQRVGQFKDAPDWKRKEYADFVLAPVLGNKMADKRWGRTPTREQRLKRIEKSRQNRAAFRNIQDLPISPNVLSTINFYKRKSPYQYDTTGRMQIYKGIDGNINLHEVRSHEYSGNESNAISIENGKLILEDYSPDFDKKIPFNSEFKNLISKAGASLGMQIMTRSELTKQLNTSNIAKIRNNPLYKSDGFIPNFSETMMDVPEGIRFSDKNSKIIQGIASDGFIPNFASLKGLPLQKYIQTEYAKKGFLAITKEEAAVAEKYGINVKYLYKDYPFIDQKDRKVLTSAFKKVEEEKAIARPKGIDDFANRRPASTYGAIYPSFSQSMPNISAGYVTGADKKRKAYRFKTFPFPGGNFDINEKLYEDVRKNLIDLSSSYFRGLITKPQIIDTNRFKTNIQSNLSRSAVESSLGQIFEAGIKASISTVTLNEIANFDLDSGELSRIQRRFKLPYGGFGSTIYADLKNSLSEGNLNSMAGKIYRFENPAGISRAQKTKSQGFIPNFANLEKAFKTEFMMGGSPVLDFEEGLGLYVRDSSTQKNFEDVKKDHPEGIKKAIKNSKALQSSFNRGFVPNFASFSPMGEKAAAALDKAGIRYRSPGESLASLQAGTGIAKITTRALSSIENFGNKLNALNSKLETTVLSLSFLAPMLIQTAAQFASQDAKTQAKYNTASQATTYGFTGLTVGQALAPLAALVPQLRLIAPFLPAIGGALGTYGGFKMGTSQEEEMLKREKFDTLNKELGILQDKFNQTQGALQQTIPLIDQYKRTLNMKGEPDVKQANLDILFEKIVDSISSLPEDLQKGVLDKIKSGKFEEIGALIAQEFAKGAAEVKEKDLQAYFEGLRLNGIKSKEEAKSFAKNLLDIRSRETGLRYTTTLAKTPEGRQKIDEVITDLNKLKETYKTEQNLGKVNFKALGQMETGISPEGQLTMSKKLVGKEGTLQYAGAFLDSIAKDISKTKAKDYLADGGVTQNTQQMSTETKEAALTLQKFVDTIKKLYTTTDGTIAPEFEDVSKNAVQIAIQTGDLDTAIKYVIDELKRTKAGASQLTEEIFKSVETTQDFIDRYRADMQKLSKFNSEEMRAYFKKIGQNEFAPDLLLAQDYDKQIRQLQGEILNQAERDRVIQDITEEERALAQKVKDRIITEDQYRNALLALIESKKTESKRDQGLMFADQYKQERQQQREQRLLSGKAVSEGRKALDVGQAFFDEFNYKSEDLYRDLQTGAIDTARTIKSEFSNAFQSIIDNSQTAEDAFRNMALNIARRIQQLALEAATNQIFSSITQGFGFGNLFKFGSGGLAKFGRGGEVKKYAYGGQVEGGSGYKDDVLTFLTGGEYIIRKSAVNKYGKGFLNKLNEGAMPKFAEGGQFKPYAGERDPNLAFGMGSKRGPSLAEIQAQEAERLAGPYKTSLPGENVNTGGEFSYEGKANFVYNDAFKPTSGRFEIDPQLSAAALYDENNPQREVLKSRYDNLQSYLADAVDLAERNREEEARVAEENRIRKAQVDAMNKAQRDNFNQWRKNQLLGGLIQAGVIVAAGILSTYAMPAIGSALGFGGKTGLSMWDRLFNTGKAQNYDKYGSSTSLGANKSQPAPDYGSKLRYTTPSPRPQAKAFGGLIKRFAAGGENKETVPALLMGGEYVIHPEAVQHYGKDFFDKLNRGQVSTRESTGEKRKPKFIDKIEKELNSVAEGSSGQKPLNRIYKKSILSNQPNVEQNIINKQSPMTNLINEGFNSMGRGLSLKSIKKRAKGSPLGGEKDNVPALLMGGEYIINKNAVNRYGSSFFDKLNKGTMPKFADGGIVGLPESRFGTSEDNKKYPLMPNSNPEIGPTETSINDNTSIVNNVNINISVSAGQAVQSSVAVEAPVITGPSNTAPSINAEVSKNKDMAEKIRTEVLKIINEQQRIGGLLRR